MESGVTRKRHVALFMPSFSGGGAERVMVSLANIFAEQGICVDLVVLMNEGPFSKEVSTKVRVVDLKVKRAAKGVLPFSAYLRRTNPDVVLTTMKQMAVCAYLGRLLCLSAIDTKLFIREAVAPSFVDSSGGLTLKAINFALRHIYKNADTVISTTLEMTEELMARFTFKRLLTIGNPVVTPGFKVLMNRGEDCRWPWAKREPIVLAVGRLTAQKDFAMLIEAFAVVSRSQPAHLVILGEGELRKELEAQVEYLGIEDKVWLPGFVENPFAYMADSDLFVMSSKGEGLPNVLIQALCTGTPVVSTRCPTGPVDLLQNGRFGRLVDVGDVGAMAESIRLSLQTERKDKRRQLHFLERFDEKEISRQYLSAFYSS